MSKVSHSFSVSVACLLDIQRAIILQHLIFLQDGSPDGWARKTNKAMRETYPYLTPKQLRGALEKMENDGLIISDFRNTDKSDRTKSYFVTAEGRAIYGNTPFAERANAITPKGKSDVAERANQMLPKGQMNIEVSYTNIVERGYSENSTRAEIEKLLTPNTEFPEAKKEVSRPAAPSAFDTWVDVLTGDYRIREGFTITQKIPGELFEDYVTRFTALARTQPEKYSRKHDLTGHFLNWSRIEYQQRGGAPSPSASQPNTARPAGIPKNIPTYGA